MMPSIESKGVTFTATPNGVMQAHCKKCGSEATIEYPAPHAMIVSCKHCDIDVSFKRSLVFQIAEPQRVANKLPRALFVASAAIAGIGFAGPFVYRNDGFDIAVRLSWVSAAVWSSLAAYGIFRYRRKGLLLLVGLPFALFWSVMAMLILWACAHNPRNGCP